MLPSSGLALLPTGQKSQSQRNMCEGSGATLQTTTLKRRLDRVQITSVVERLESVAVKQRQLRSSMPVSSRPTAGGQVARELPAEAKHALDELGRIVRLADGPSLDMLLACQVRGGIVRLPSLFARNWVLQNRKQGKGTIFCWLPAWCSRRLIGSGGRKRIAPLATTRSAVGYCSWMECQLCSCCAGVRILLWLFFFFLLTALSLSPWHPYCGAITVQVLPAMRLWLESVAEGGTLLPVGSPRRTSLLKVLKTLPVSKEYLRVSGIGKVVMAMVTSNLETAETKAAATQVRPSNVSQ